MSEVVYDVPIGEVASILTKSDRQVRRYVKERKLRARPVRIDGHIKLMFNRDEVHAFGERFADEGYFGDTGSEIVVDAHLVEESAHEAHVETPELETELPGDSAVKYVIDALREQIRDLRKENQDLHYQLEQRSGQVGFLQGKVETLQEEMKMLMPSRESQQEVVARKPWYRRFFGRNGSDSAQQ